MRPDPLRLIIIVAITAALTIRGVFWLTDEPPTSTRAPSAQDAGGPLGSGVIAGVVYDEHNRPAPDRQVRVLRADPDATVDPDAAFAATTRTDRDGRYEFTELPPDRYLVMAAFNIEATERVFHPSAARIAEATRIDLEGAGKRMSVDLRFRPAPRSLIEGVVQRADDSARLVVTLVPRGIAEPQQLRLTTTTDAHGRFTLGPVPADDYWVVAHTRIRGTNDSGAAIADRPYAGVADVTTNGRDPVHVTVAARPAMRVSARLIFQGPEAAARPDVQRTRRMLQLRGRDPLARALLGIIDTPTRVSGDVLTIHGVPAGRYALVVEPAPPWWLDASNRGSAWPERHLDIHDGTDVGDIELTFTDDSETVSAGGRGR